VIRASYTVDDELTGPVEVTLSLTPEHAYRVAHWAPSVARLYLGHEAGPVIQDAIRKALADLDG